MLCFVTGIGQIQRYDTCYPRYSHWNRCVANHYWHGVEGSIQMENPNYQEDNRADHHVIIMLQMHVFVGFF
jgi:hypothetical protein